MRHVRHCGAASTPASSGPSVRGPHAAPPHRHAARRRRRRRAQHAGEDGKARQHTRRAGHVRTRRRARSEAHRPGGVRVARAPGLDDGARLFSPEAGSSRVRARVLCAMDACGSRERVAHANIGEITLQPRAVSGRVYEVMGQQPRRISDKRRSTVAAAPPARETRASSPWAVRSVGSPRRRAGRCGG